MQRFIFAALTVFAGLSFAIPTFASSLLEYELNTYSLPIFTSPIPYFGYDAEFTTPTTTAALYVDSFHVFARRTATSTGELRLQIRLGGNFPDDGVVIYDGTKPYTDFSTSDGDMDRTFTFTSPLVFNAGQKYWFRISGTTGQFFLNVSKNTAPYGRTYWSSLDGMNWTTLDLIAGGSDHYVRFPWTLFGTSTAYVTSTYEQAIVPTSTFGSTPLQAIVKASIPTVSWAQPVDMGNATTVFSDHISAMVGTSTFDTFPLCFVTPVFNLMDLVKGAAGTSTRQGIVLGGAGIVPTSTWYVPSMTGWMAETGFKDVYDMLIPFAEAIAWFGFCWYIFVHVFSSDNQDETL